MSLVKPLMKETKWKITHYTGNYGFVSVLIGREAWSGHYGLLAKLKLNKGTTRDSKMATLNMYEEVAKCTLGSELVR